MVLCSRQCTPCCDFCAYVHAGDFDRDGTTGPIGCNLHDDEEHQEIAESCGHCDDFHCFLAKEE